ncbi:penicillin-binding protein [Candidatus Roizmanbacteria bacterium CG_4_10_14_0_8_um_filter_39_9]|uniref:Penicillin-binding protein n=1 Tax=Candidatus Roizmanbacteria bacterium CG_4_10_14_0_8_um_filter_39_9 TaxID=1974829 RepID=A0A2M7QBA0_9BACT|nr:MAG: penicillin-binding protein [Candidatus Roizmanbacteria bacterium CG_4_10_14_0_8_um_filter_39_9]
MFPALKFRFTLLCKRLSNSFFLVLFLCIKFFVLTGEVSCRIIFLPVYIVLFIWKFTLYLKNKKPLIRSFKKTQRPVFVLRLLFILGLIFAAFANGFGHLFRFSIRATVNIGKFILILIKYLSLFIYHLINRLVGFCIWVLLLPYRLFISFFSMQFRFAMLGFIICLIAVFFYQSYQFIIELPSPKEIGKVNFAQSTHLYDRNGKMLYEIYRDENRTPIHLNELPPFVKQATIAIEDKDFYRHNGVSFLSGIVRAAKETLITKSLQGGSTLTQQLVKTALLTPERTITRKVKEIILALWTEKLFTKDQILEMYLNQVPYGGSSYGIEEASKTYFGKHAKDLTLDEATLLAGLPQAPSVYSPYVNPDLAVERRNDVIKKMREQRYIDENSRVKGQNSKLEVIPLATSIKAPHFVFYVKERLEGLYGSRTVEEGGLNVNTTLDLNIQMEAEKILKEELEKVASLNVGNGAILVTKPETGEILAMVGSSDYFNGTSGAFNVTTALRQPGSSIKPLMYSLALEKGFTAATILDDSPISFIIPGSRPYQPVNYDGRFHGKVPLRYALANSYNIPAVRTLSVVGVGAFVKHAEKLGISTWDDSSRFGLSLTLGGGEVYMTDMATAFGVIANGGRRVDVADVLSVEDMSGRKLFEYTPSGRQVLSSSTAYIMSDILSDNFARRQAFGINSTLEIPGYKVAVKTGTTDEKKDNWTIGYTPEFLVAVWVGNNDNAPMNPYLASGVTGAAPIWNRVMKFVLQNYGTGSWFVQPKDVVSKPCYYGKTEYFAKGTETKISCRDNLSGVTPTPTP